MTTRLIEQPPPTTDANLRITSVADFDEQQFLITFRALAQRIPAGFRFDGAVHCRTWCIETFAAWTNGFAGSVTPDEIAHRLDRIANRMWMEIALANLDIDGSGEHGQLLLNRAIVMQRQYRKDGRGEALRT